MSQYNYLLTYICRLVISIIDDVIFFFDIGIYLTYGSYLIVASFEIYQTYALCCSTHHTNIGDVHTYGHTTLVDNHYIVTVIDKFYRHKFTRLLGDVHRFYTLTSTVGNSIYGNRFSVFIEFYVAVFIEFVELRAFAVTLLGHHKHSLGLVCHSHHTDHFVAVCLSP